MDNWNVDPLSVIDPLGIMNVSAIHPVHVTASTINIHGAIMTSVAKLFLDLIYVSIWSDHF